MYLVLTEFLTDHFVYFFQQMKTMFIEQYEDIYLGILEKGINDAIHNASALVFLAIEANGTQTFNTSTFLYNSKLIFIRLNFLQSYER